LTTLDRNATGAARNPWSATAATCEVASAAGAGSSVGTLAAKLIIRPAGRGSEGSTGGDGESARRDATVVWADTVDAESGAGFCVGDDVLAVGASFVGGDDSAVFDTSVFDTAVLDFVLGSVLGSVLELGWSEAAAVAACAAL
jgi:hypothetical protein